MTAATSILALPIASIAVRKRIGLYHPTEAAALATRIAVEGQHDPIHVQATADGGWALVAGLHRLRAVEMVGGDTILALQVADADTDAATLLRLELSENLDHRQLRPIERAMFMAARACVEEAIDYPDSVGEPSQNRAGRARQAATNDTFAAGGWQARTAAAFQVHPKTFREYQRIHRGIVEPLPALAEQLNAHVLGGSLTTLLSIVKLDEKPRRHLIETIIAHPDLRSLDAAFVAAGRTKVENGDRFSNSIATNWARLNLRQKKERAIALLQSSDREMRAHFAAQSIKFADPEDVPAIAHAAAALMSAYERRRLAEALADQSAEGC